MSPWFWILMIVVTICVTILLGMLIYIWSEHLGQR